VLDPKGAGLPRRSCTEAWRHADAAGRGHTRDVVRAGALPVLQISIALFDHLLLKISKQKWTKRSIAKL
jgi:hypothetical protein